MAPASGDDRVTHQLHGPGIIQSWRRGGRVAVVRFDTSTLPIAVPARELSASQPRDADEGAPHEGAPHEGAPREDASRALTGTYESQLAALTLEAMRLGVVPATSLEAYTVGRTAELALVDADLARVASDGGAVRAFLADYGVGKTHMLELVQHRALEQNYLTAMVMLDANETPPSHPKRVFRGLMRALRYPDRPHEEGAGLGPLLARAAATPEALEAFHVDAAHRAAHLPTQLDAGLHLYLTAALAHTVALASDGAAERLRGVDAGHAESHLERCGDLLLDWIEGHPTVSNQIIDRELSRLPGDRPKIYSLMDYRPWSRIFGYLLSGLAALARAAGYAGLVILLDEAEFYALLSKHNRLFAAHLFKAWTWAAIGEASGLPFGGDALDIGGAGILKDLPGRYGDAPGLYTVFAMTPNPDGLDALAGALPERCSHTLTPLDDADYRALAASVCDFYASAQRDFEVPEKLVGPLSAVLAGLIGAGFVGNPRQAMKFIIEFLDVVRFHPQRVGHVVRNLQRQLAF